MSSLTERGLGPNGRLDAGCHCQYARLHITFAGTPLLLLASLAEVYNGMMQACAAGRLLAHHLVSILLFVLAKKLQDSIAYR